MVTDSCSGSKERVLILNKGYQQQVVFKKGTEVITESVINLNDPARMIRYHRLP